MLGIHVGHPELHELIRRFLYEQLNHNADVDGIQVDLNLCPKFQDRVFIYSSAVSTFYAPSDLSGIGGMRQERIHAVPTWFRGRGRYDTMLLSKDANQDGFAGLYAVRALLFLSFTFAGITYPCSLVHWFSTVGDRPDDITGMWKVRPDFRRGKPFKSIIHLDCVLRGTHLSPVYANRFLPQGYSFEDTLNDFKLFYVNKFIDHHSHEILQ
jgi:hypothetical protein